MIAQLGLDHLIPYHRPGQREQEPYTQPQHLRSALEELGTTFIKLGQILSTRADLLPEAYVRELSKLQSSVPPIPFSKVKQQLDKELGETWPSWFSYFEETPLASASVGQVHRAVLQSGEHIVVKIQRPSIEETIKEDLEILEHLAELAQHRLRLGKMIDFPELVRNFGTSLFNELDYRREGKHADRFRNNFYPEKKLHIPKIHWEFTTKRVLAMEELEGYRIDDVEQLKKAHINTQILAKDCASALIKMIFEDGFFHADPHPGNFYVTRNGTIGLIDFGLVGELDEETRSHLIAMFIALAKNKAGDIAATLINLGPDNDHVRHEVLKRDIQILLDKHIRENLTEIDTALAMQDLLQIIYRHKLHISSHLSLLAKTIIMCEGIGRKLDPEFNLTGLLSSYAPRLYIQQWRSQHIRKKMKQSMADLFRLSSEGPRLFHTLLKKANRNELEIQINVQKAEPFVKEMNQMVNRLSLSILTSAHIIGLALLLLIFHPESNSGGPSGFMGWLFSIGFVISLIFGGYVLFSIFRSSRKR